MGRSLFLENNQMKYLLVDISVSAACSNCNRGKPCSTGSLPSRANWGPGNRGAKRDISGGNCADTPSFL
jgi:hypothetical protein